MKKRGAVELGDRRNQEINRGWSAMLAALGEGRLSAGRERLGPFIERERRKLREIARELLVVIAASR